jgi:anti-sigma B factor antagonist
MLLPDAIVTPNPLDVLKPDSSTVMPLRVSIRIFGDVSVLHCVGRITLSDEQLLRSAIRSRSESRAIVLDLAQVSAIDTAGLGTLVAIRGWAIATGVRLKLMNVTPRVEEVLHVTNLKAAFEVCSFREMMALLCRAIRLSQREESTAGAA